MNVFDAQIAKIESEDNFHIIYVHVNKSLLKLLRLELPTWIDIGDKVRCSVDEAAISICKGEDDDRVSIENRISAKVLDYRESAVLSEVTLDTGLGSVVSLITSDAMKRLCIEKGNAVTLLLKAVDIKLIPRS